MLAVKATDLKTNFKLLCERVCTGETLIVARPKNENVVVISQKEYNELLQAKKDAENLQARLEAESIVNAPNRKHFKTFDEIEKEIFVDE